MVNAKDDIINWGDYMDLVYHYTSINTLALILKNRTIRLNCLKNVDDMDEGLVDGFGNLSDYFFASSWTEDGMENIALWNMYAPNMTGVRIGLPCDMLNLTYDEDHFITNGLVYGSDSDKEILIKMFGASLPQPVVYDSEGMKRQLFSYKSGSKENLEINSKYLGLAKNNQWEFQQESRFRVLAIPKNHICCNMRYKPDVNACLALIVKEPFSIDYIDLPLKNEALKKMEIMLGPNCIDSDKIVVESLVRNLLNSKNIKIEKSQLKIRQRYNSSWQ